MDQPRRASDTVLAQRIVHEFAYHPPPRPEVAEAHEQVRAICREAAEKLSALVPATNEREEMLHHLRLAMFWANAGIACYPDGRPAVPA